MKPLFASLLIGSAFMACLHAEVTPEKTNLWPGPAPGKPVGDKPAREPWMDVYLAPAGNATSAGVVVFPGGGYGGLAADHEGHQIARFLNDAGVSAFVVHYRLGSEGYHYPVQLRDAQRAIRLVRSRAQEWELDSSRIGVVGFSAGGHLASMTGTLFDENTGGAEDAVDQLSARPDFLTLCYPVISMSTDYGHGGSRRNLLGQPKPDPKSPESMAVSTELLVRPDSPPTFLFHTGEDTSVPPENSILFYLGLREHGIPAEMHIYQKGPHGVGLMQGDPILSTWGQHWLAWMRTNGFLKPPEAQVAVQGEVTLDGTPVSWGSITFYPEDEALPLCTARIRNGRYQLPAEAGPAAGPGHVEFTVSIYEATQDPADGPVRIASQPDGHAWSVDLKGPSQTLDFALAQP